MLSRPLLALASAHAPRLGFLVAFGQQGVDSPLSVCATLRFLAIREVLIVSSQWRDGMVDLRARPEGIIQVGSGTFRFEPGVDWSGHADTLLAIVMDSIQSLRTSFMVSALIDPSVLPEAVARAHGLWDLFSENQRVRERLQVCVDVLEEGEGVSPFRGGMRHHC